MDKRGWHERQREQIAGLKRKQENMRRTKMMRADKVVQNYHDAWRSIFPGDKPPRLEYMPNTGKYKLDHGLTTKILPEATITDATTQMYAIVHERNLKNDPDEPGTHAHEAAAFQGFHKS